MHLTVYEQSEIFYFSFVFGVFLGIYYDLFRFLRYLGFTSKFAVILQDIIFMSTAAAASFLFSQTTVNGHLRAFVIFAELIGILSYRYSIGLLSGFVFAGFHFVIKIISRFLNFLGDKTMKLASLCSVGISAAFRKIYGLFTYNRKRTKKVDTN